MSPRSDQSMESRHDVLPVCAASESAEQAAERDDDDERQQRSDRMTIAMSR